MINVLTEMLLSEYFLYVTVCGKLIKDRKKLFEKLSKIFLVSEKMQETLYSLAECEEVRDVKTHGDYMQYRRIQKYSEITELEFETSAEVQEVISIKGKTLEEAVALGFKATDDMSEMLIYRQLCDNANKGIISAIRITGFLQCEGIFIGKNDYAGRKNLEKSAQWNSEEGILTALFYDKQNRQENINRLLTVTSGTAFEEILKAAEAKYKIMAEGCTEGSKLMKKAIGKGILKADIYSVQYARFIYSPVLKYKEKERAMFSGSQEAVSATAELPLKLTYSPIE